MNKQGQRRIVASRVEAFTRCANVIPALTEMPRIVAWMLRSSPSHRLTIFKEGQDYHGDEQIPGPMDLSAVENQLLEGKEEEPLPDEASVDPAAKKKVRLRPC